MTLRKVIYVLLSIIALFFLGCNLAYNISSYEGMWLKVLSNIAIILDPLIIWILFSKQGSKFRKGLDKLLLTKASEEFHFETMFTLTPIKNIPFDSPKKDFIKFIKKFEKLRNLNSYRLIKKLEQKGSAIIIKYDSTMKYPFIKFDLRVSIEDVLIDQSKNEIKQEICMFFVNFEFIEESRNIDLIQAQIRDIRTTFQNLLNEIYGTAIIADIITFSIKRKKILSLVRLPEGIKTKKLIFQDSKNRDFEIDVKDDKLQITTKNLTKEAMKLFFEILILNY